MIITIPLEYCIHPLSFPIYSSFLSQSWDFVMQKLPQTLIVVITIGKKLKLVALLGHSVLLGPLMSRQRGRVRGEILGANLKFLRVELKFPFYS